MLKKLTTGGYLNVLAAVLGVVGAVLTKIGRASCRERV